MSEKIQNVTKAITEPFPQVQLSSLDPLIALQTDHQACMDKDILTATSQVSTATKELATSLKRNEDMVVFPLPVLLTAQTKKIMKQLAAFLTKSKQQMKDFVAAEDNHVKLLIMETR